MRSGRVGLGEPGMWGRHTCTLLGLDQPRGPVHAHDEASRHLGVQGAAVARLLHAQDAPYPGNHLMRRRIGRFVQVDETRSGRGAGLGFEEMLRLDQSGLVTSAYREGGWGDTSSREAISLG